MTHDEKRKVIQEAIVDLHRAIKALQALDSQMGKVSQMKFTYGPVRSKAKRASMDATRSLAQYRRVEVY